MLPNKKRSKQTRFWYGKKNKKIWKYFDNDDEEPQLICREFEIIQSNHDVDSGKVTLTIRFDYHGISKEKEISRELLQRNKITDLIQFGVDVQDDPAKLRELLQYLLWAEEQAPLQNLHSQLGLYHSEGKLVFKHHKCAALDSTYSGPLAIKPKGAFEEYVRLLQEEVLGQTPLELALSLGMAAPIASMIAEETGLEVMVVHICGNSSSGKSTACMISASLFGSPNSKENGLIKTWNATENAFIAQIRNIHGLPIVFDEASVSRTGTDFSKTIYKIASGKDKERLNQRGEAQAAKSFSGLFLSNAEHSLRDKGTQNIGVQVRLQELANITWTRSAENAEELKEGLLKNYGHLGPAFAEKLIELGTEGVMTRWKEWREKIRTQITNQDDFTKRISDKLAIIALAADLTQEWFGLKLDIDGIVSILLESVDDAADNRNLGQKAYQYVIDEILRNRSKFATGDSSSEKSLEYWGKIAGQGDEGEIWILPQILKKILSEGQFDELNVILRLWRDENLLDHDPQKLTRKKVMPQGITSRVYVLRIQLEQQSSQALKTRIVKRPKHNPIFDLDE